MDDTPLRDLVGQTFRDPQSGRVWKLAAFTPDPEEPGEDYLGTFTVYDEAGNRHRWYGHEVEHDLENGNLVLIT